MLKFVVVAPDAITWRRADLLQGDEQMAAWQLASLRCHTKSIRIHELIVDVEVGTENRLKEPLACGMYRLIVQFPSSRQKVLVICCRSPLWQQTFSRAS